jgi:hypothetical protein
MGMFACASIDKKKAKREYQSKKEERIWNELMRERGKEGRRIH